MVYGCWSLALITVYSSTWHINYKQNQNSLLTFLRDYLLKRFNGQSAKILSRCRSGIGTDPILWLSMTRLERYRCLRWRPGWLPVGSQSRTLIIQVIFSQNSTSSVAFTCITDYKCLSQSLILHLSCWINCLRNLFYLLESCRLRVRWPAICISLHDLNYLTHEENPTISLEPGIKPLKWLSKISFKHFKCCPLLLSSYIFTFTQKVFSFLFTLLIRRG